MTHLKTTFAVIGFALSACTVDLQDLTSSEMDAINKSDRAKITEQVDPVGSILTLDEAVARALKYNLDQRVLNLEQSLSSDELESGKYDMLPTLLAKAGYDSRDNFSHRWTGDYIDANTTPPANVEPTPPSVSVEPKHTTASLALSWNILDFGASYYTAKQNSSRLMIANERRRKSMHTLVQDVRATYWRALASETLARRVKDTISSAEKALNDSRQLSGDLMNSPEIALRYQRNLLENLRLLESVEQDLAIARHELINLIGAQQGTRFKLVEPKADVTPLRVSMQKLEQHALLNNADLRTAFFDARIASEEARKAILKLMPGISFDVGYYGDSDRYLVNNQWSAAGLNVSYNLFNLLSADSRRNLAQKTEDLAEARRMALQMTVVTQVHLATHEYTDALAQYSRADQIYKVDKRLEEIVRVKNSSNTAGEQAVIAANVTAILSELRRYQAMAKFQKATGYLHATLGMEPVIGSVDDFSLEQLTDSVGVWLDLKVQNGQFEIAKE